MKATTCRVLVLGGYGLFGVEFFVTADEVIFSELSPRPHDTGMVTLIGQDLSEFDLHARAIMELPIPEIIMSAEAAASAVILADRDADTFSMEGLGDALALATPSQRIDVRLFSKPVTRPYRRMGITLATGTDIGNTRAMARAAAEKIKIRYAE